MAVSVADASKARGITLESRIRDYGEKIFALVDAGESTSLFSKKGFYGALMEWAIYLPEASSESIRPEYSTTSGDA